MMARHWTQISEQNRRHVVFFQLILNNCSKRGVNITSFLLPAIKCSQLLLQQNALQKQTNTSSTEQHRKSKLRAQMTPAKESEG